MVNSDLKKLAVKKGMKISHNICYGILNGYTVTLRDINNGRMIRELYISTVINQDVKSKILEALNSANAQKQYKIDFIDVNDSYISIGFVVSIVNKCLCTCTVHTDCVTAQKFFYFVSLHRITAFRTNTFRCTRSCYYWHKPVNKRFKTLHYSH